MSNKHGIVVSGQEIIVEVKKIGKFFFYTKRPFILINPIRSGRGPGFT